MRVVGVIDLKGGRAVHASGGRRESYVPVATAAGWTIDGDPVKLARLYLDAFGLKEIYVADLDAIGAAAPPGDVTGQLSPLGLHVFLDAGVKTSADAARAGAAGAQTIVVGLETLESFDVLGAICRDQARRPIAFSLDLRDGVPMTPMKTIASESPEEISRRAVAAGVRTIIVLDVARVGRQTGPDFAMLRRIRTAVPAASVLAGGGIRNVNDLRQLAALGCDGALVATALHTGDLSPDDVAVTSRL